MPAVSELAYLGFEVSDPGAWAEFARRLLGIEVCEGQGGLELRYDERGYRIVLRPGVADDLAFLAWEAPDEHALDELSRGLEAAGTPVHDDPELAALRRVRRLAWFDDPAGNRNELVVGPEAGPGAFNSAKVPGGYTTGELGMGHLALNARTREESEGFYCQHLGLRLSDRIRADLGVMKVDLAFLRANRRHHSLAVGGPLGRAMHHFMLQMNRLDDVGRTLDRARRARLLTTTLGRHSNDRMISFYLLTPSGFQVEIGYGGVEIDDATWQPCTHDTIAVWGHRPLLPKESPP